MAQVVESVDVDVDVTTAYNQWTQFESFPKFLSFVESITQIDDTHTHWKVNIAGAEREFDATITEQHPDERVAWNSTGGEEDHAGVVTFHRLSDTTYARDRAARLEGRGLPREGRRRIRCRRSRHQGRPQELQEVHRVGADRDGCMARRRVELVSCDVGAAADPVAAPFSSRRASSHSASFHLASFHPPSSHPASFHLGRHRRKATP